MPLDGRRWATFIRLEWPTLIIFFSEARETKTSIWWNVWVLLATPAIWMAWFVNVCLL